MANEKKITIQDVAVAAEVSVATVSRVLNKIDTVKESTKIKVLEAIENLGYEFESTKEYIPMKGNILLVVPSINNPFYTEIIRGSKTAAMQRGYYLLIYEEHILSSTLDDFLRFLKREKPAGLLITNQIPPVVLEKLAAFIPLVQCCEHINSEDYSYVGINETTATANAVAYLGANNKKKIAFLNGPEYHRYAQRRLDGYKLGLEQLGIEYDPKIVFNLPDYAFDVAVSSSISLLKSNNIPDAFLTSSDIIAAAILRAAYCCHLSIPKDFSVIGFGNYDFSANTIPSLSTINIPRFQIGFSACEMLINQLQDNNFRPQSIILDTEFILRESTLFSPL